MELMVYIHGCLRLLTFTGGNRIGKNEKKRMKIGGDMK